MLQAFRRSPSTTGGGSGTSWSTSTRTPTTPSTCWCANWSARDLQDGRRRARRAVRGRRRRPVDLRVPRRDHPQHRGLRARLPERHNDSAGAELPLDAEHPVGGQLGHLPQRRAPREAAVDRRGRRRAHRRLRRRQRARRGRGSSPRRSTALADTRRHHATTTSRCSTAPTTQSRALEEVFIRAGIPYKVVGGVRFYERREIRDIVAYLRVLDNPGDTVSMRRILNTPRRGIGDRAEACVAVYAENTGASLQRRAAGRRRGQGADAEHPLGEGHRRVSSSCSTTCAAGLDGELGELGRGGTRPHRLPRASSNPPAIHRIWRGWTTSTNWSASHTNSAPTWPTPRRWARSTGARRGRARHRCARAQFLERVSLVADADELPEHGAGVVTMMTLHTAKGLEFPVVFVTGWEDGMFPHMRALGDPTELSEERRLAYVGITRARQRLYLSRAKVRSSSGQPMLNPESRFLREIPQELIDWRRTEPAPSLSAPGQRGGPVRHAASVAGALGGRQAPAAGAGAGRPGQLTTSTASAVSRRCPASASRPCRSSTSAAPAGQADAQPRARPPSSDGGRPSMGPPPGGGQQRQHDAGERAAPESTYTTGCQSARPPRTGSRRSSAPTTEPTTISSHRPIRRRSSSAIRPPIVAAAEDPR